MTAPLDEPQREGKATSLVDVAAPRDLVDANAERFGAGAPWDTADEWDATETWAEWLARKGKVRP